MYPYVKVKHDLLDTILKIRVFIFFLLFRKSEKVRKKRLTLRENFPYSEFFWSAFSRIRTEYVDIRSISPYSVRMRENTDQKNSEEGHFSRRLSEKCHPEVHPETN